MEFDNSFEVPLPPARGVGRSYGHPADRALHAGCQLTDVVDDKTYKGKIAVRLGPVSLAFAGMMCSRRSMTPTIVRG